MRHKIDKMGGSSHFDKGENYANGKGARGRALAKKMDGPNRRVPMNRIRVKKADKGMSFGHGVNEK